MGDMTTDFITLTARVTELERENAELRQRRTELQQANTDYLERARKIAGKLSIAEAEIKQSHTDIEFWRSESLSWAAKLGSYRQYVEDYNRKLDNWIEGIKYHARYILVLDLMLLFMGFLVISGIIDPVFR